MVILHHTNLRDLAAKPRRHQYLSFLNKFYLLYKLYCNSLSSEISRSKAGVRQEVDIVLGLVGSILGTLLFRAMGVSPEAGIALLVIVAFVGAAIAIVAQRKLWEGHV